MALKEALAWFCLISVVSFSGAVETSPLSCSLTTQNLTADLQMAAECAKSSEWTPTEAAEVLNLMRNLADSLHKHQLKACQNAEPKKCQHADVPANGGLICATAADRRLCKPMCNSGHDFAFVRRGRLFDECSEQTNYKWSSQYVGGSRLAVCNKESTQIGGAASAYFPEDCLTTKSGSELTDGVFETFKTELKSAGINDAPESLCLVCG